MYLVNIELPVCFPLCSALVGRRKKYPGPWVVLLLPARRAVLIRWAFEPTYTEEVREVLMCTDPLSSRGKGVGKVLHLGASIHCSEKFRLEQHFALNSITPFRKKLSHESASLRNM